MATYAAPMKRLRILPLALISALISVLLGACQDGRTPSPPHRVPKPKVEHKAADPIKTGPVMERRIQQV